MSIEIQKVTEKVRLGEGPFWDEDTQSLYFVDIFGKLVCRYTPSTNAFVKAIVGHNDTSFIIPIEGKKNHFLVGYGNQIVEIIWDGVSEKIDALETIVELKNTETKTHKWNDGKVDASGRLWAGTLIPKPENKYEMKAGSLYTLQFDKTLKEQVTGISGSNGLAWDDTRKRLYYVDTMEAIYGFDYDEASCQVSNQEVVFKFSENGISGYPDGMTIDADGNLWITSFGGGKIVNFDPNERSIIRIIDMPVVQITSVAFGGPNYEDLYVTTGGVIGIGGGDAPDGGYTYRITGLGVRGLPAHKVKL